MRKIITSALAMALIACATSAFGGQAWTDTNGDGQPDLTAPNVPASTNLTVDLWIDSQSFTYTSYNIWAEWTAGFSRSGGTNVVTGCSNDPVDTFSHPRGIGFAGSVCNPPQHGVHRIGTFVLHVDGTGPVCVAPIIDTANPYNVFSLLASPAGYMVFQSRTGSCFNTVNSTESKSWGQIKSLYN